MRTGSLFSMQAAHPRELGLSDLVGGGVGLRTSRTIYRRPLYAVDFYLPAPGCLRGRDVCARGLARQTVGRQGRRPADRDVTHRGVARRLSVLLSLPVGMQITRDGISEPQFSSVAEGIRLCRCSRRFTRKA